MENNEPKLARDDGRANAPRSGGRERYRSIKDEDIALALARGLNQRDAAREAGVSERTVRRRLDDPVFVERVIDTRVRLLDDAVGRVNSKLDAAAEALVELLGSSARESTRLRAAQAMFAISGEYVRGRQVDARIDELTRQVSAWVANIEDESR
jgi:hypothetical protein